MFHVSQLRKYVSDPSHVLEVQDLELSDDLSYQELPIQILDYRVKTLRNRDILLVKVLWRSQRIEKATWEVEAEMRERFPDLFR